MQMCGVSTVRMSAMAGTWQVALSDAKAPPVWRPEMLYCHTLLHTLPHLTCVLPVAANGKAKALQMHRVHVYHFPSCSQSLVKLLFPDLFEMLHVSST